MKILHVITSLGSGGAERMLSKLVVSDQENEHIIITILKSEIHYDVENVKVINLDFKNNIISKFIVIFFLRRIISKERPDIIQTWMKSNFYGPLIKNKKVKLISNFRSGYNTTLNPLLIKIYNAYFSKFDGNIFVSKSSLSERVKEGMRYRNKKIINNAFKIPSKQKQFNNYYDILKFGHVGRYHPVKNQKLIIDSFIEFSGNKKTELILAGKDLTKSKFNFEEDVKNIYFCGELSDLEDFYLNIDVLILASTSEGFPNVIGEAMSYGIPVITSDAGESFEIIGEAGYKLSDLSQEGLVSLLKFVHNDKCNLKLKGEKSRKRIKEKYNLSKVIKEYQEYYKKIGDIK